MTGVRILQYSEMECKCAKKITERLFGEYSALWQHIMKVQWQCQK